MQLIFSVSVSRINSLLILISPSPIKAIFKSISAPKQWLVSTTFFVITPLHIQIHFSRNYLRISLHVFILIFLITLPMNTPRTKNQFVRLIPLFLHSILMIRPTFLRYFVSYFCNFYATPKFLPQGRRDATSKRAAGREQPTTRKKGPRPYPKLLRTLPRRRAPPAAPAFPEQSRRGTAGATADG